MEIPLDIKSAGLSIVCTYLYLILISESFSIWFFILFFIVQRVKARAIPYPHQPPSRGDNTVSVAQGGANVVHGTKIRTYCQILLWRFLWISNLLGYQLCVHICI